jgi:hypothetical protein
MQRKPGPSIPPYMVIEVRPKHEAGKTFYIPVGLFEAAVWEMTKHALNKIARRSTKNAMRFVFPLMEDVREDEWEREPYEWEREPYD